MSNAQGTLEGELVVPVGLAKAIEECTAIKGRTGPIDVLVIGDHAGAGYQVVGENGVAANRLTSSGKAIDDLAALMTPKKGVLVLTGCRALGGSTIKGADGKTVVKPGVIEAWQTAATSHQITIIGSVGYTKPLGFNTFDGIWVTLKPGGTAPSLTCDPDKPPDP